MTLLKDMFKNFEGMTEAAELANASYKGEKAPDGWTKVSIKTFLKSAKVKGDIDFSGNGARNETGNGYVELMKHKDGRYALSFRGTDTTGVADIAGDVKDYLKILKIKGGYIKTFDDILISLKTAFKSMKVDPSKIIIAGHSLGGAAVNQLFTYEKELKIEQFFGKSKFITFSSPLIAETKGYYAKNLINIGLDNDIIFRAKSPAGVWEGSATDRWDSIYTDKFSFGFKQLNAHKLVHFMKDFERLEKSEYIQFDGGQYPLPEINHSSPVLFVRGSGEKAQVSGYIGYDVLVIGRDSSETIQGRSHKSGPQNEVIEGFGGDDIIKGVNGTDHLFGSEGDDKIYSGISRADVRDKMHDYLFGGSGDDFLYGSAGGDQLDGGTGVDRLYGSRNDDHLEGFTGDDYLYGEADNDTLNGSAGNDYLSGGEGDDIMIGGSGKDRFLGGKGSDRFYLHNDDIVLDKGDPYDDDHDVAVLLSKTITFTDRYAGFDDIYVGQSSKVNITIYSGEALEGSTSVNFGIYGGVVNFRHDDDGAYGAMTFNGGPGKEVYKIRDLNQDNPEYLGWIKLNFWRFDYDKDVVDLRGQGIDYVLREGDTLPDDLEGSYTVAKVSKSGVNVYHHAETGGGRLLYIDMWGGTGDGDDWLLI